MDQKRGIKASLQEMKWVLIEFRTEMGEKDNYLKMKI